MQPSSKPRKRQGLRKRRKPYRRNRPNVKLHYEGAVLISIPESMRITGLGATISRKWVKEGRIPAVQIDGRWYVIRPKLLEWLASLGGQSAA
jgi:hypothetical protein